MEYYGRGLIAMDSDLQRWIEIDSDGYILSHTMDEEKKAIGYYGQILMAIDRNRQRWIAMDMLLHSMDKRRQQCNTMDRDGQ